MDVPFVCSKSSCSRENLDCELGMVCSMHPLNTTIIDVINRASFARRDAVYYSRHSVRTQDAVVIICTISSNPVSPQPPPVIPKMIVPKDLLDAVGSLLDNPLYCDIEFIIPARGRNLKNARRIYAAKSLLSRAEYFETSDPHLFLAFTPCVLTLFSESVPLRFRGSSQR